MRIRLIFLLASLCLAVSTAAAQSAPAGALGSAIDQRAANNGLPSGDGSLSPAEQSLGELLGEAITSLDTQITELEQASPDNSAWVASVEQRVQEFDQQMTQLNVLDPRAQAISDAVDQYGREIESGAPLDPRAQAISDAVDQYGRDLETINQQAPLDPRAQAISDAVDQYGRDLETNDQQAPLDPRAQAISDAVDQYGREIAELQGQAQLSSGDQQRVVKTVREGAEQYINQSPIRRKAIIRQHVRSLVEFMVPRQLLPINGRWRALPFTMTRSGNCAVYNGDNDGPSGGEETDPGQPLCGFDNPAGLPFIVWQGSDHPYLPGTSSIYSRDPQVTTEVVTDQNGRTVGSIKVTTTVEYEVVAPDKIIVHLVIQEEGGCTLSGDYVLELVAADESVCTGTAVIPTPEPEPTELPPLIEGPFRVGLPLYNDEKDCDAANSPPPLDEIRLHEQTDGSVMIDYGAGTQVVYSTGGGLYLYNSGWGTRPTVNISLYIRDDRAGGSLSWSTIGADGKNCYASHDFSLPEEVLALTPTPEASDTTSSGQNSGSADTPAALPLTPGEYSVTWAGLPGLECPEALLPLVPTFTQATIAQATGGYTLEAGGEVYLLTDTGGSYSYLEMRDDGSGRVFAISGAEGDGTLIGAFNAYQGQEYCIQQMTLKPL